MDWFKKIFNKPLENDLSDFPTVQQRIEQAKGRIVRLKLRIRELKLTGDTKKLTELQNELFSQKQKLKKLEN